MEIEESWGSFVDCTPDAIPVISEIDSVKGFFLAAGSSAHGFGLGPGLAHIAADLVMGRQSQIDTHPYRLSRLLDGSKVKVGAI